MPKTKKLKQLQQRYATLQKQLGLLNTLLVGTIQEHRLEQTLADGKKKTYGPYYAWTWKEKGKTVTVTLTKQQAPKYQRAIVNQRKLLTITKEMRTLSLEILEQTTTPVKRRKQRPFLPKNP